MSTIDQGVGSVSYPGIQKIISASYTRSHGITPDVCQIEMAPQSLDPKALDYTEIATDGLLIFEFVTSETLGTVTLAKSTLIEIPGCRPDRAAIRRTDKTKIWQIPIYDRRWKWKFGSFSGHWNIKKNGIIERRKERTARQLADMCLEAMGELKYETRALDELETQRSLPYRKQVRPEVHWDRIPPAQALNELVTKLGYRVCLGWDDRVRICKFGEGKQLPVNDLMEEGFNRDVTEVPDSITVVGGISMHEALWELEAVGLDIDGEWRPIDHLSYRPQGGWKRSEGMEFPGIKQKFDEVKDNLKPSNPLLRKRKEQYKLARDTVFRSYRLKYPFDTKEHEPSKRRFDKFGEDVREAVDSGLRRGVRSFDRLIEKYEEARRELFTKSKPVLPGPKQKNPRTGRLDDYILEEFEQVLPTFETRAELSIDSYTGKLLRKPVEVSGEFWSDKKVSNTLLNENIEHEKIKVMTETGIIKFSEPVFLIDSETEDINGKKIEIDFYAPARLYAMVATPLKSLYGEPSRYEYQVTLPNELRSGTATKVVKQNEIVHAYQARYELRSSQSTGKDEIKFVCVVDNESSEELNNQAQAVVDVETLKIFSKDAGSGVYAGLIVIEPDGAIQQVTIVRNQSGMTTTVSRNQEVAVYVPDYDERQRVLTLRKMVQSHTDTVDLTDKVRG